MTVEPIFRKVISIGGLKGEITIFQTPSVGDVFISNLSRPIMAIPTYLDIEDHPVLMIPPYCLINGKEISINSGVLFPPKNDFKLSILTLGF